MKKSFLGVLLVGIFFATISQASSLNLAITDASGKTIEKSVILPYSPTSIIIKSDDGLDSCVADMFGQNRYQLSVQRGTTWISTHGKDTNIHLQTQNGGFRDLKCEIKE